MKPIDWGARTARMRGPVLPGQGHVANAIGAYAGGYALYRGLAQASGVLDPGHRANLANTGPAVPIGPFPAWSDRDQIVSFDPWGHRVAQDFTAEIASGLNLRPTIAVAQGRMRMGEICDAMDLGRLKADGKILNHAGDISVVKIAIEPDHKDYAALTGGVAKGPAGGGNSGAPAQAAPAFAAPARAAQPSATGKPSWAQ